MGRIGSAGNPVVSIARSPTFILLGDHLETDALKNVQPYDFVAIMMTISMFLAAHKSKRHLLL